MTRRARFGLVLGIAAWCAAVAVAGGYVVRYAGTPGDGPSALAGWPRASHLELARDRPTLVVFAHPKCSCTRATLTELAHVVGRVREQASVYVVFARPSGVDDAWMRSDLWARAERIPGVTVVADTEDGEAKLFGVKTSGTTLLFDATGAVRFSGGITVARGHEGPSAGQDRLLAAILGNGVDARDSSVFGCGLEEVAALADSQP